MPLKKTVMADIGNHDGSTTLDEHDIGANRFGRQPLVP
jgi:hypothetical protein